MMGRRIAALAIALTAAACGPSLPSHLAGLRVSAKDAMREARPAAVSWSPDAALRYVEGEGVGTEGYVTGDGYWRFTYEAPGIADQLVVTVGVASEQHRTRARMSPPGFVLGTATLDQDWIDSPRAAESLRDRSLPADTPLSMLLVPIQPPQWVVRSGDTRWRIDARSGAVIGQ